ncbi:chaperone protein dnaJ 72 [Cucurbita pepo subsp. pepo]|uniref:chaperone protein dnaJ 72 n=1 Tax=Cucurbita pepo subsp. pepo TaxID=3664 RepID=UPI000C9D54C0|nr:chaperone protein dnaJ 72 [Cucurbita pepo subsp. pepo]
MDVRDHYKVLGLNRSATKEEVKEAFRKLAKEFHPDKHSQSPKAVRDSATLRFKQVSEAYEILGDDCKRADYNIRSRCASGPSVKQHYYSSYNSYANASGPRYGYGSSSGFAARSGSNVDGLFTNFHMLLRFLTTRAFLLNLAFAGVLVGGMFAIDTSGEALWKMHNSGKSFEEAMESINKAKTQEDA